MDDFGGRTDDDLFSDDIEPVDETVNLSEPIPMPNYDAPAPTEPAPVPVPVPVPVPAPAPAPAPAPVAHAPAPAASPKPPRSSLAMSRHNPNYRPEKPSRPASNNNNKPPKAPKAHKPPASTTSAAAASDTPSAPASAPEPAATTPIAPSPSPSPKPPPTGPREPSTTSTPPTGPAAGTPATTTTTGNTASAISHARLSSGANPRTKLTETELAARMEKMRLLAAEKTRRFEEAQRDESEHAVAYAKGMEEARKRKADEAARRKVADEERRKLEDERARNRERKLKAMGMKEGGWDAGKEEQEAEVDRGFRSAHGGVRGVRGGGGGGGGGGGLGGSRFAAPPSGAGGDEGGEYDGFGLRGRGGGYRGRGGRGRGGRGGGRALFDEREGEYGRDQGRRDAPAAAPPPQKKAELKKEEFPALPTGAPAPKKLETTWVPRTGGMDMPLSPPVGKWDEEVAASLDAANNQSTS